MVYFMNAFQGSITANLTPYVVSSFESHSLIPVIYIVSNVMAGSLRLAVAKMLDLWGRSQGFAVMVSIATLGLILMAVCTSVQTFSAAQVRLLKLNRSCLRIRIARGLQIPGFLFGWL
jgi:hypothetical protein